ncbi:hypothetical protein AmaxDRAFT_3182 [Limnospira maxima CS-328]|uniref:Uncharacterized protein n=1 Tax=Limnospira maxima CS-328 TaxID=513049 RepID=B5W334_LIMMA|nr:hypothetical protein [Limnospira maxima]EDZ94114.1 hypothetical protein AmaxDRAFT_3182 [Limnospira maxima CS-328]
MMIAFYGLDDLENYPVDLSLESAVNPVHLWDKRLEILIATNKDVFNRHFLLPGRPANGYLIYRELKALAHVPQEYKTIVDFPSPEERQRRLSQAQDENYRFVLEQWLERIEYLCHIFPFLEVLPIAAFLSDSVGPYRPLSVLTLKQRKTIKLVSLEPIETMEREWVVGGRKLTKEGWLQLFPELRQECEPCEK